MCTIKEVIAKVQEFVDAADYPAAKTFLRDIITGGSNPECISFAHHLLGRVYFYGGHYVDAKKHFTNAILFNRNDHYSRFFVARSLQLMGQGDDALKMYLSCATAVPDASLLCDFMGEILLKRAFEDKSLAQLSFGKVKPAKPVVSVIILCYNKVEYTERCLKALFKNTDYPPFEVIVLDNASVDYTPAVLEMYSKKIKYMRCQTNLGFVKGNNCAADLVDGDFIVFLNNDTEVQKNWLKEMYHCFKGHPRAAAVGSMLVYPDMKLQEAGGIIFSDATGWNYGRGSNMKNPSFTFAREVDYCSGAALMVRTDLFLKVGKFDERFAPAYFEDSDLCFSLRKLGYKVIYCPSSVVIHHEGITAGTDLNSGMKRYQVINRPKFQEKWKHELSLQYPSDSSLVYQFSNRKKGKRVLIIDDQPPLPDRAAGSLRMYHTAVQMATLGYRVTYVHLMGKQLDDAASRHLDRLRSMGIELIWFDYESWWPIRTSPEVRPILKRLIDSLDLKLRKFDFAYIIFWYVAGYFLDLIREADPSLPIVVETMDLHYLRELRHAEVMNDSSLKHRALQTKKLELKVYSKADCITSPTETDRENLRKELPDKAVLIMTDVHDIKETQTPFEERSGFLYVGSFNHTPNEDAVVFFVERIFPLIKRTMPAAKFIIVGNNPSPKVKALASNDIIVTGWVPEIRPYLDNCRVEVVPLRYGAGNKGKVGEAFAHGIPMVMTPVGAEGMDIVNGKHAFITENPEKFAEYAVRLYNDKHIWEQFSEEGKKLIAGIYSSGQKRKRIEYLTSFETRKSFQSYRALRYPLPPKASILVIESGNGLLTHKCLTSIRKNTTLSHEIFLISRSGYDGPLAFEGPYPEIRLLKRSDYKYAYPRPLNRAISTSLGDYIVIIKDHVEVLDGWIEKIVRHAEVSEQAGIVVLSGSEELTCALIKRGVIEKIGGFDERFAPGNLCEDADLLLRAKLAGFTIEIVQDIARRSDNISNRLWDDEIFVAKWGCSPEDSLNLSDKFNMSKIQIGYPIDKDEFIEDYERALQSERANENERALLYLRRAIKAFHRAERSGYSIEFPELLNMAGEEAVKLNELEKANKYFGEAVTLSPLYRDAVINYGKLLIKTKKVNKAVKILENYLLHYPQDEEIKQLVEVSKDLLQISQGDLTIEVDILDDEPVSDYQMDDEDNRRLQDVSTHGFQENQTPGLTSIIILTFNQLRYTKECVESIRKHTPDQHEIIFVDNGSKDGTVKWLRRLVQENPSYKLFENERNLGFAKGCNQGILFSSGEYILLLNNDVVVTEGWLSGMLECLNSTPDTGVIGPMTNNVAGIQKIDNVGYSSVDHLQDYAQSFREKNRHRRIPAQRLVGFCMIFRRALAEKIGLLDERFGTGGYEDNDYCLRAAIEGYSHFITGDVFIHHYGSRSFKGSGIHYASQMDKNWQIFSNKWGNVDPNSPTGIKHKTVNTLTAANQFNHQGLPENAVRLLFEGIKANPDDQRLHYALADIFMENKKFTEALGILEKMPESLRQNARWFENIALCKKGLQLNTEAGSYADKALLLNSASPIALNVKGLIAFEKGLQSEAEDFFTKALEADSGFAPAYLNISGLRWLSDDKASALDLSEKAFILSPVAADIAMGYYSTAVSLSQLERAESLFKEASSLYPSNRRLKSMLIDMLIRMEKYAAAMKMVEETMISFGIDENTLAAALELRGKVGPMEIQNGTDSISLCMIVKDEQFKIGHCLSKIKPAVDELIVVDTGSRDRTKDIAKAFGAKVYDFPWADDFSEARNFALSKAAGKWILILDADEVISSADYDALKELVKKARAKPKAFSFITRNYVNKMNVTEWTANDGAYAAEEKGTGWFPGEKVRLFPNAGNVRFEYPVHERVEPSLVNAGIKIVKCDIPVHHYGKLDEGKTGPKAESYYNLAQRKVAEQERPDEKVLHELAVQAGELGKYEEALEYLKKVLALNSEYAPAYRSMGNNYFNLGRYEEALAAFKTAVRIEPDMRDAVLMRSACEIYTGNAGAAIQYLEDLLRKDAGFIPAMTALAAAYFCLGQKNNGAELVKRLKELKTDLSQYFLNMHKNLTAAGQPAYAASLLESLKEIA